MKNLFKTTFKIFLGIFLAILVSGNVLGQTTILSENFEHGGSLPTGWTSSYSSPEWQCVSRGLGSTSTPSSAHNGNYCLGIYYDDSDCDWNRYYSPSINLSTYSSATLSFYLHKQNWAGDSDELKVYYRTSSSGDWTLLETYSASISSWTQETVSLPNLSSTYQIAFRASCCYGYGVYIDDVTIIGVPNIQTYTVTYNANGGTGTMTDATSYNSGSSVTVRSNTFTRDGYEFIRWNTQSNGSGESYDEGVTFTISSNITLYAQWSKISQPNTIILNQNISQELECNITYHFYDSGEDASYSTNESYKAEFTVDGDITINFSSFSTEYSASCYDWDWIEIYDGDENGILLVSGQTGCSTRILSLNTNYTATSGTMTIVWKSDGSNVSSGWESTIIATNCNSCKRPSNLQVSNITANSVHITWESENINFQWSLDNSTWNNITGTSIDLNNLNSETDYIFYIKSDCGNDESYFITTNFTTTYLPLQFLDVVNEPVCWDFETNTIPSKWATEGYETWHIGAGARNGRGGTHNGSYNMEIDVDSWGAEESYFITPILNLSNIESGNITFWYINPVWGESYPDDIDEIGVVYRIGNGEWSELFNTTSAHEEWTSQTVAMTSQMFTNNVEIAFRMKAHYGYGVGLDDICLELYDAQGNMLPINLLEFSSEPKYDPQTRVHLFNLLTIRTGGEWNNCQFTVYRSSDAINWDYDNPVCDWDFGRDTIYHPGNWGHDPSLNPNYSDTCEMTYYPIDYEPYEVTYYKLLQRDCDNTTTEYTSEIIVCIANQQKHLIEPYVICDNGPQVVGGSEVCEVFVQNVLGQVVEEFQLQPYQQREVLSKIQGMYLITFVYKYNGEARKKTEKIICM